MANVLCVMAHPDDEVLGCGGTLAKHAEAGDEVTALAMTQTRATFGYNQACKAIGAKARYMQFDDQSLDRQSFAALADAVFDRAGDPDIIYTHHPDDLNLDHALTAKAVLTAFRPKPGEKPRTILACEVLSSTEYTYPPAFQPNWFEALSGEQLQKKVDALACYETEVQPWPHPRSALGIRNLAAYRGQSVGVEAAEAFQLLRRT